MSDRVSIILPTYNRAAFMPEALGAILGQNHPRWDLIVVDDGSTDETQAIVERLCADVRDRVTYIRQENQGAYPARNTGLAAATGDYVAFYDSDDLWLPHHLSHSVEVMAQHPEVDWVYAACRMVDQRNGREIAPHTFYVQGRPRPFLALQTTAVGRGRAFADPGVVACAIEHGLYCGLQNSVIRRRVFGGRSFHVEGRGADVNRRSSAPEDQLFTIRSVKAGFRLAYIDAVHVDYRVHDSNSSSASGSGSIDKRLAIAVEVGESYEDLMRDVGLDGAEMRAARRRLNREYFWHAGYALLWQHGRRREALEMFRRGLRAWPWSAACWKTYALARLRTW